MEKYQIEQGQNNKPRVEITYIISPNGILFSCLLFTLSFESMLSEKVELRLRR